MRARLLVTPPKRVHLALDAEPQHPVHRRVVFDLVHAVAEAVVLMELRDVALRAPAMLVGLGGSDHLPEVTHPVDPPAATLALDRLPQRDVRVEDVDVDERLRLVDDLVRRAWGGAWKRCHVLTLRSGTLA